MLYVKQCCRSRTIAEERNGIFLPDEYLARNVAHETGGILSSDIHGGDPANETILDKPIIGWKARCEVHEKFTVEDIQNVRKQFPDVVILSHPNAVRKLWRHLTIPAVLRK